MKRLGVAAGCLFFAAGCGGTGSSGHAAAVPQQEPTTAMTSSNPTPIAVASQPSAAKLKSELLSVDDLPSGWTTFSPATNVDSRKGFCNQTVQTTGYTRVAAEYDKVGYKKTGLGPVAGEVIRGYPTTEAAQAAIVRTAHAVGSCASFKVGQETWKLQRLSSPNVGDDSFAVRLTSGNYVDDYAYNRVGPTLVAVAVSDVVAQPALDLLLDKKAVAILQRG